MARLNNRPSTVAGSRAGTRTRTRTPDSTSTSDQENRDPRARRDHGKGRMSSLPTPTSGSSDQSRGQKRKRAAMATQDEDLGEPEEVQDAAKFKKYYDPNQDAHTRRQIKRKARALQREFTEKRDEYLKGNGKELRVVLDQVNHNFKNIKQTGDAMLDSRLLVEASDVAHKMAQNMALGGASTGVDVDEFISKCIRYMREDVNDHVPPTQTQRRPRRDEDDEDNDDPLDWELLGRHACFPFNSRPACPTFLLGPLSVQKKVRVQTQRRARQVQERNARESRPETLAKDDLSAPDQNALTLQCANIKSLLRRHVRRSQRAAERIESEQARPMDQDQQQEFFKKYRVSSTGSPSLFDFVVNPNSFGQTVENLFYVSFLIKEGNAGIVPDKNGLATLVDTEPRTVEIQRAEKTVKNQSVFSIDYSTWQDLIKAFDITEPLIPHRSDEQPTQVGSRGWYA